MCVCLCVICVPPLSFCSKSTLVECLPFGCFLPRSHVTCCLPSLPCLVNQSMCSASISNQSPDLTVRVCVCSYKCVCVYIYCVYIGVCMRVHAPSSPPPLLSFICFPFQPLHEVMNAWVWFFFLPPPPPLPPSHASSLFCYSVGFFGLFLVLLLHLVYFLFCLPPLPLLPPFLWHSELG